MKCISGVLRADVNSERLRNTLHPCRPAADATPARISYIQVAA